MKTILPIILLSLLFSNDCFASNANNTSYDRQCLLELVNDSANDTMTAAELKQKCTGKTAVVSEIMEDVNALTQQAMDEVRKEKSLIKRHRLFESIASANPFSILPYKPNYFATTYNWERYQLIDSRNIEHHSQLDNLEAKFQLSFQFPLLTSISDSSIDLMAGYTQISWWQMFNSKLSAPFRETNYEPELWFEWRDLSYSLFDWHGKGLKLAINHQSNGRSGLNSRSWNRVYLSTKIEHNRFLLEPRIWYRLPENKKESPLDGKGDDNPDITDYLGHGDLKLSYRFSNRQNISLLLRNNFKSENRGAVQMEWSVPVHGKIRTYIQYFNGYGESLIEYNNHSNRIGIGFELADWLY